MKKLALIAIAILTLNYSLSAQLPTKVIGLENSYVFASTQGEYAQILYVDTIKHAPLVFSPFTSQVQHNPVPICYAENNIIASVSVSSFVSSVPTATISSTNIRNGHHQLMGNGLTPLFHFFTVMASIRNELYFDITSDFKLNIKFITYEKSNNRLVTWVSSMKKDSISYIRPVNWEIEKAQIVALAPPFIAFSFQNNNFIIDSDYGLYRANEHSDYVFERRITNTFDKPALVVRHESITLTDIRFFEGADVTSIYIFKK